MRMRAIVGAPDAMPDVLQRALDPCVAPGWILPRIRTTSRRMSASTPRRLGRAAYVHFLAMSWRCQRSKVSGVTIVAISRSRCRPSRYARTTSRRRSSSVRRRASPSQLPLEQAILFDQVSNRLPLQAIQPAGQHQQQQLEGRGVNHEREVISATAILARGPSIQPWDRTPVLMRPRIPSFRISHNLRRAFQLIVSALTTRLE